MILAKKNRKIVGWIIAGAILMTMFAIVLSPLRTNGANKYLTSGDEYLKNRKFISAIVEYRKAEFLAKNNGAKERINLAREGEKDIMKLEPFFREANDIDALNELSKANAVPEREYDAVVTAKKYVESGRPDLAILATETAIEMDENYLDAWLYLGIGNLEMMKKAEISAESREYYKGKATEALNKALSIDPTNENVKKYLDQLK